MRVCWVAGVCLVGMLASAQKPDAVKKAVKTPAALEQKPWILWDAEVTRHWPRTLDMVNIPGELITLSPGQCLRVGVMAKGDGHEHFLDGAMVGFSVNAGGATQEIALAAPQAVKQINPEGQDAVNAVLVAGGVKFNAAETFVTMAASAGRWCVPVDAEPGKVTIRATAKLANKSVILDPVELRIIVPETPPALELKDDEALSQWLMSYHQHPEPALMGVALDRAIASGKMSQILQHEFVAMMKQDPATARRLGPWLAKANHSTQVAASLLLSEANVTLGQATSLSPEDKASLAKLPPLDDPFVFSPDQSQFSKLDELWVQFLATGDHEPVDALVSMLSWSKDYPAFLRLKEAVGKGQTTSPELTPELVRGIAYTAVGWSLASFQRTDGLAADYLAAIAANPATPASIHDELSRLDSNPAFKRSQ